MMFRMSMEMDLMSPFLLRQTAAVSNVHVTVTSLNRVQLDRSAMSKASCQLLLKINSERCRPNGPRRWSKRTEIKV